MAKITYSCEVCSKDFESGRVRKGKKICGPCATDLRKKGQGPVQLAKAGVAPVAGVGVQPKVEVEKAAPPTAPPGTSLSQLAKQIREKHEKGEKTPGEPIENVEE